MRIINRVIRSKETKDGIVTHVTERIIENDQYHIMPMNAIVSGSAEHSTTDVEVTCDVCTCLFDYNEHDVCRCPSCGSRSVRLA